MITQTRICAAIIKIDKQLKQENYYDNKYERNTGCLAACTINSFTSATATTATTTSTTTANHFFKPARTTTDTHPHSHTHTSRFIHTYLNE